MSALEVGRLTAEGDHHVGGVPGLLLRIKGGSRVWVLRAMVGDARMNIGLGPFPEVPLAKAREAAKDRREKIRCGDVAELTRRQVQRKVVLAAAAAMNFKTAAAEYIEAMRPSWKNEKHGDQWTNTLETYAYPVIGDLSIPDIGTDHILQIIKPMWSGKTETASRVRGRIESVIDYYAAHNRVTISNPARWKGHLEKLLPKKTKVARVKHHTAIHWKDAPVAFKIISGRRGVAAKALMGVIFTACRVSELIGMRKGEIFWDEALWIAPAERVKGGTDHERDHYIPLSAQMIELLRSMGADEGAPDELVFTSSQRNRAGEELTDAALLQVMKKNGIESTTHGWRSTFKDWAGECGAWPNELSEMALAHTIENKAEAAYRRGDMLERRRPMMQQWADYLTKVTASGA